MTTERTESKEDPDYRERLSLAIESVGSEDLAHELLSDKIKDAFLLKFKIKIETKIAILMILVSAFSKKILFVYALGGNAKSLNKIKPYEDYVRFMHEFVEISAESGIDAPLSQLIGRAAYNALPENVLDRQIQFWEEKKMDQTIKFLTDKIAELTKFNMIQIESDLEKLSSVNARHKNMLHDVVKQIQAPKSQDELSETPAIEPFQEFINSMEPKYDLVLRVKTMIAPSDGKMISQLTEEDTVFFKPLTSTQEQRKAAELMKLITKEGKLKTIEGRVLKVFLSADEQYHILSTGPDNTLLHAIDGQELKVAIRTEEHPPDFEPPVPKESKPVDITIPLGVVLVIVSVTIAYFIFLA